MLKRFSIYAIHVDVSLKYNNQKKINTDAKTPIFIFGNILDIKPRKSGHGDALSVVAFAIGMFHADLTPPFEDQNYHVGTSLVGCAIFPDQSDLSHVVNYDVCLEILFVVLNSADIENICSSPRGGEDSSTMIVSIADI